MRLAVAAEEYVDNINVSEVPYDATPAIGLPTR
jgi:hypothetical protein